MSSATSTNRAIAARRAASLPVGTATTPEADHAFRPWQFFLLAGMLSATATVVVATGQSPASIVLLSLTVVSAAFVGLGVYRSLAPLVLPEIVETPTMLGGRTRAALERDKALVLRSIKELEFDYAMKKVARADYDDMAGRLRARAIRLMRQLEAAEGYRTTIEKEVEARLAAAGVTAARVQQEPAADVCACGTSNDLDARFCKHCGSKLDRSA
jgi:hypothetical protein